MDVVDTFNLVKRRKTVVIPVLVITVLMAAYVLVVMPPGYTARGSVLVKDAIAEASPISPALFAELMQGQDARAALQEGGATGQYTVSAEEDILRIRAIGSTESEAVATVNSVLDSMAGRLAKIETEAGVDRALQSTVTVVNAPQAAIRTDLGFEATGAAQIQDANASATPVAGETLRDALIEVLSSENVARSIAAEGGRADYEFGFQNQSPILQIEAVGTDEGSTVKTVQLLVDEAAAQSKRLAEELGGQSASGPLTEDLVVPNSAVVDRKGPLRSVAAIGVVGIGLALSLAVAIEAYAEWRRRTAEERAAEVGVEAEFHGSQADPPQGDERSTDPASSVGPQGWRSAGARSSRV